MTPKSAIPKCFLLVALLHIRKDKGGNDLKFLTPLPFILIDSSCLRVKKHKTFQIKLYFIIKYVYILSSPLLWVQWLGVCLFRSNICSDFQFFPTKKKLCPVFATLKHWANKLEDSINDIKCSPADLIIILDFSDSGTFQSRNIIEITFQRGLFSVTDGNITKAFIF